jgi:hypothetical protein
VAGMCRRSAMPDGGAAPDATPTPRDAGGNGMPDVPGGGPRD